jgi:hypothetical protein
MCWRYHHLGLLSALKFGGDVEMSLGPDQQNGFAAAFLFQREVMSRVAVRLYALIAAGVASYSLSRPSLKV